MLNLKVLMVIAMVSLAGIVSKAASGPTPVENFDIERYQGLWHQLSAIPASFQKTCVGNTTAEYSLLPDGLLKVVNSCDKKNGKRKESEARARVNAELGLNSTLQVTFVKLFNWIWSFGGDYWVIYISENYDVAIVGHPEYEFGWILSKKEILSEVEYSDLHNELTQQGYNTCDFKMSNTPGQSYSKETSLCELVSGQ